jgi:hypothetical protein
MTNLDDFDRSLSAFLADGPAMAPEAPVIAALAHARTTPRRTDPLGRFRSDAMASPHKLPLRRQPVLAFGLLALLAASVGVAVIGSRPTGPSTVIPGPSGTPRVSAQPSPSHAPFSQQSDGPTDSPTTAGPPEPLGSPAVPPIHVALLNNIGNATSIDIVDESGQLVGAVSGPVPETVAGESFDAVNDTPATIRLTWLGSPCDTVHRLTIDAKLTTLTIDRPHCYGDAMPAYRSLILTFSRAVDAAALNTSLHEGRGGVGMPNWTAAAPDSAGNLYDITLADPGYVVDTLAGYYDPEIAAGGAGPAGIRLVRRDATTFRLVWLGPACATAPALSIDPSGDHWQLADEPCTTSAADVLRMIEVTVRSPRTADAIPSIEAVVQAP